MIKRSAFKLILKIIIILTIILAAIAAYAYYIEPELLIVRDMQIKSQNIQSTNQNSEKIKVVFFSDTHFREEYNEKKLDAIVEKINEQDADIVAFGGDLIDSYYVSPVDLDYLKAGLSKVKAKYGKFAVYGNHDYGGGASRIYGDLMTESGFTVLKNDFVMIDEINTVVYGMDDYLLGNPDKSVAENADKSYYNILLSHAPDIIDDSKVKNVDFILSGHTHGGQVFIPFFQEKILPPGGVKYVKGLYNVNDSQLFVSSGIGTTKIKFRFLNVPEIMSFKLERD